MKRGRVEEERERKCMSELQDYSNHITVKHKVCYVTMVTFKCSL